MPAIEYTMYFDNNPATREQLDQVEEITVEQEENMIWEAQIKIPVRTDEKGNWKGQDEDFLASWSRVRVEIKVGDNDFAALIDGPIVGFDNQGSSEPGQSYFNFKVQDDSVYLDQTETFEPFEDKLDHEIAADLLDRPEQIKSIEFDITPASGSSLPSINFRRGTEMDLLRQLARRHNMYAAVLPGENPGESIGCFKKFPTEPDGLPPITLLGAERNIESFSATNNTRSPANVKASTLSIGDKVVVTRSSSFRDLEKLGEEHAFDDESNLPEQILPPGQGETVDLQSHVDAEASRSGFAFDASGTVQGFYYNGVLSPYRVVVLRGVANRQVGNYLIKHVTHKLTRSNYTQAFKLRRDAQASASNGVSDNLIGSIF